MQWEFAKLLLRLSDGGLLSMSREDLIIHVARGTTPSMPQQEYHSHLPHMSGEQLRQIVCPARHTCRLQTGISRDCIKLTRSPATTEEIMLVLSRRRDESIHIDGEIEITVLEVRGNRVRLGIDAPDHIRVARSEIWVDAAEAITQPA